MYCKNNIKKTQYNSQHATTEILIFINIKTKNKLIKKAAKNKLKNYRTTYIKIDKFEHENNSHNSKVIKATIYDKINSNE